MSKIFDRHNINHSTLIIPQEEGGSEDDRYLGSIGDATARHVSSLSHGERQLWQELIITKSGFIYRAEPSPYSHDLDPFDIVRQLEIKELESKKCVENIAKRLGKTLDESFIAAMKEAIEEELKRREQSEDAFDKGTMIPYHQMEEFPGMEKHVDIPSTPRDWLIYMGNTNQQFLDAFPDGHPDSNVILRYIHMLDKDDAEDSWYDFVRECLDKEHMKPYVRKALSELICEVSKRDGYEDEHVMTALEKIDNIYRIEYLNKAATQLKTDKLLHLLLYKEKEWKEQSKKGQNIYPNVRSMGRLLYEKYKNEMKSHHWARYQRLRKRFAPQVIVKGRDINRCKVCDLMSTLNLTREDAIKMWHARPFESVSHAIKEGHINRRSFANSEQADKYLKMIEKAAEVGYSSMSTVAAKLIQAQRLQKDTLRQQEWKVIWSYYRVLREDAIRKVNNERQENGIRLLKDNKQQRSPSRESKAS